ncbi:hypothetical protein, partial [Methylibium petroleiphilum]
RLGMERKRDLPHRKVSVLTIPPAAGAAAPRSTLDQIASRRFRSPGSSLARLIGHRTELTPRRLT